MKIRTEGTRTLLSRWAGWAGTNPGKVLLITLAITVIMLVGISMLKMDMTFFSIMPQSSPQVRDLRRIIDEYPFASALVAVVDGRALPEERATETVKAVIDEMTAVFASEEFSSSVQSVYSTVDTEFLEEYGLLLVEPKDLARFRTMYADPDLVPFLTALNDDLEREYSGDGDALEDDEMQIVAWVRGVERIMDGLADTMEGDLPGRDEIEAALDDYLIGETYFLSRSEDMGVLFINPTYSVDDLARLVPETDRIEERVRRIAEERGVTAGLTGITVIARDEFVTSEQGVAVSMLIAFVLILLLMVAVFRIRTSPIIIGLPLLLGIVWTIGVTGFTIQRLSIITAMYMVALVGLGVDYAVHLMTGFVQERDRGRNFIEAITGSFTKSGRGIVTGALTTAAAFFALLMADSEMIRELGIVAGIGIICEMTVMFMVIPALLGWRQKRLERKGKVDTVIGQKAVVSSDFVDGVGQVIARRPGAVALALLILGVALGSQAPNVTVETNLMELQAEGLESIELQDTLVEEFGAAPDTLYLISDDRNELPSLVDDLEDLESVKAVDTITHWWPTDAQQAKRRPYLRDIRDGLDEWGSGGEPDLDLLTEELYRLEANLVEMGDLAVLGGTDRVAFALNRVTGLDDDGRKVATSVFDRLFAVLESDGADSAAVAAYRDAFSPRLRDRVYRMAGVDRVTLADLPTMTTDTFLPRSGSSTLTSISPRRNPWDGEYRSIFTAQVGTVTERGTGMILAADQLMEVAQNDGGRAMIAALVAVFIILLFDFRNLKLAGLTFAPLVLAFVSLYGVMAIFDIKFDFLNIIAIPLLVGIGVDNTVHINHRYLIEGRGEMRTALARTGSAVALTTITTMIGFASFIPSIMRAMRSTGIVLTVAMALSFIYAVLFHPAVLVIAAERWGWNLRPNTSRKEHT